MSRAPAAAVLMEAHALAEKRREHPLTPRQARFVREFAKTRNLTASARAAGYAPKTAHVTGAQLLRRPKIKEGLRREFEAQYELIGVDAALVAARLFSWLELNPVAIAEQMLDPETGRFEPSRVDPEVAKHCQSIKVRTRTARDGSVIHEVDVRLPSKIRTIELLGKHTAVDAWAALRGEIGVSDGLAERIIRARERVRRAERDRGGVFRDVTPAGQVLPPVSAPTPTTEAETDLPSRTFDL